MEQDEYVEAVHEQVQGHGYKPVGVPPGLTAEHFYLKRERLVRKKFVSVSTCSKVEVAPIREIVEGLREAAEDLSHGTTYLGEAITCFPLVVLPSTSDALETYVREREDSAGARRSNVFPSLVDLEEERLVHRNPEGIKKLLVDRRLPKEAKQLFQL